MNSSTPYTYKPKTAEPAASFYKPPPPSHSSSFYKPPPPPKKLDINDAVAFPSLMATMPPRASMRTASKESIPAPKPKLSAWTTVAAKPAAEVKPAEVKPAEEASVGFISGRRNAFDNTSRSLSAIGTRCFDDGPEDYDGPDEGEEGEGEGEGEFNAHLTLDRRRGEKIL